MVSDSFFLQQLKSCDLFHGLSANEITELYAFMTTVHIKAGDVLVRLGDPSDSLHVLLSGRLIVKNALGQAVGQISRGQTVGEMGLITQEPRSATVIALRDSLLLQLDSEHFMEVCRKHPSVLLEVAKTITRRLQRTLQAKQNYSNASNIVIFPAHRGVNVGLFMEKLSSRFNQQFRYRTIAHQDFPKNISTNDLHGAIQEIENNHDYLFYEAGDDKKWREFCLDRADHIYVLADASHAGGFDPDLLDTIKGVQNDIKKMLVLLHDGWGPPTNTQDWLDRLSFSQHHHVCWHEQGDFDRLLRFVSGSAVGLVLGGGGTRSWAHAGVIKYLFENNVTIDACAGTSAGAISAALMLAARDLQDFLDMSNLLSRSMRFNEYTIPLASLLSSKSFTHALQTIFGAIKVEDLRTRLFCVAADLVSVSEVVISRGLVWRCLRATAAIPGIYPPVHDGDRLLIDGGVVNNLPVDVMKDYFDGAGQVIAVDISEVDAHEVAYNYPLDLNWRWILRHKIFSRRSDFHLPPLAGTLMKGMVLASDLKSFRNIKLSTVAIRPVLSGYGLLDFSKKDELLAIGHAAAAESLKDWPKI
ncbi:MAG: hypothetical protein C0514_08795 [Candidatus Puniceispirillum sp.]|nr:hypothetical protein [Candidatus Puniceispirillum sp.]